MLIEDNDKSKSKRNGVLLGLLPLLRGQPSTSGTKLIGIHVSPSFICNPPEHSINYLNTNNQLSRLPGDVTLEEEEYAVIYIPSNLLQHVEGNSMMREILVYKIYQSWFSRPTAN